MQVFKTYMKVVKKNLFMAIVYTIIFIILAFMFSNSSNTTVSFEDSRLGVCIIDEDNSKASKALTEFIGSNHNLVELENNKDEILDALYYTRADYVLIIKSGFEEKISKGETDNLLTNYKIPDSYNGVFLDNSINQYVSVFSAYIASGNDAETSSLKTAEALSAKTEVKIESFSDDETENTEYPVKTQFYFNCLPYAFLSVLISILSTVLIKMNKKEIAFRTNCSSTTAFSQTAQILLGSIVLVIAVWVIFMLAGILRNGGIFTGKVWLAVLNSFAFVLVSAGIAILISIIKNDTKSVAMIANIISLGMSFLCGVFVEQALLGESVLSVARFLPAYWYIKANDMLMFATEATFNSSEFFTCIGIEALFAAALFAVILLVSKIKHSGKQ